MKNIHSYVKAFFLGAILLNGSLAFAKTPCCICTAADDEYFPFLKNLIGSLHRFDADTVDEIMVFDLGFTEAQRAYLRRVKKVQLYSVEKTNDAMFTHFQVRTDGRLARGWYSWKPVVIKQALNAFPVVLYLDAGLTLRRSIKPIFSYIKKNGYFLRTCEHSIDCMTTKKVRDFFELEKKENAFILDKKTEGISAGVQGLTRQWYDPYVYPLYEFSHDISLFEDDGSTPDGFGTSRHDQPLFSIMARLLHMKVARLRERVFEDKLCFEDFMEFSHPRWRGRGRGDTFSKYIQFKKKK
jgi:hypothetical protein